MFEKAYPLPSGYVQKRQKALYDKKKGKQDYPWAKQQRDWRWRATECVMCGPAI